MWNDRETTQDLLNFRVISDTAAQLIIDAGNEPLSIGISGSWGVGKSSLVKMIGKSLDEKKGDKHYLFVEFNAWLYQGYDDAKSALLNKVADFLLKEAELQRKPIEKIKDFITRINWIGVAKFVAPVATGAIAGTAIGGPIGGFIGAVTSFISAPHRPSDEDFTKIKEAYDDVAPELTKLLNESEKKSIPKEIDNLRSSFKDILNDLDINLVILVDDLDRCLPNTAISTLEAMRLLLFMDRTAFIIAADEQMIRNAVKSHFGAIDLSDELVTSYFDKLIQIPLRVPRLGANEVKGYLILLLADLAHRRGQISLSEKETGEKQILKAIAKSWSGGLTKRAIDDAYGEAKSKISTQIDLADQLANIMTTSDYIAGNPRLIKRFLNNLIIRESVARAQEMSVSFEELVKMQLFERCAPAAAFEFLAKQVGDSEDGKPKFLQELEQSIAKGEEISVPHESWKASFISDWLKLSPSLSEIDLRPLLYLSRDKAISLASFDELSPEGRSLQSAICEAKGFIAALVASIKQIGVNESEKILNRMRRRARNHQWDSSIILQAFHLPKAHPDLAASFIAMLDEIPANKRPLPLIPHLRNEAWAKELLSRWEQDESSQPTVRKAISSGSKK